MSIDQNITTILQEIDAATLVCVTKTIDTDRINEAIIAGATIIGENRVQEFEDKCANILPCERHLIGHLQSNKVKKAVQLFDVIQSVDSLKLIRDIDKKAKAVDKVQNVYLQINIGNEPQKFGFKITDVTQVLSEITSLKSIQVKGLMCIPPFVSPDQTVSYFHEMKALFDDLEQNDHDNIKIRELSMGMSNDYRLALENGSTMVRVGSAIFGARR